MSPPSPLSLHFPAFLFLPTPLQPLREPPKPRNSTEINSRNIKQHPTRYFIHCYTLPYLNPPSSSSPSTTNSTPTLHYTILHYTTIHLHSPKRDIHFLPPLLLSNPTCPIITYPTTTLAECSAAPHFRPSLLNPSQLSVHTFVTLPPIHPRPRLFYLFYTKKTPPLTIP